MPDRIDLWSITRRALQEQHDQRREKSNGHPVINCTHSHHPTQEAQSRNEETRDGKRVELQRHQYAFRCIITRAVSKRMVMSRHSVHPLRYSRSEEQTSELQSLMRH